MNDEPVAIILAAGKSTRMKSPLPKVLQPIGNRRMIDFVLDAVRGAGVARIIVVIGHKAGVVWKALRDQPDLQFALQTEQKGTGHAVRVCRRHLEDFQGAALVLAGDTPLIRSESLTELLNRQKQANAACVIGTAITPANDGLGRIVRDDRGEFVRIVEEKDASPEEKRIEEINTGCYAFRCPDLFEALEHVRPDNRQAEYYLTDCPAILRAQRKGVLACPVFEIEEALGVNTHEQLRDVQRRLEQRQLA